MVRGSRQRNSTSRVARGTRSLTQIIVGTSSTTMPTTVSAASISEVTIARVMVGSSARLRQASRDQSPVAVSCRLKSASASSGSTKNVAKASSRTPRSIRQRQEPVTTATSTCA